MNTIKDYYVELHSLYSRSVKMLTALNAALTGQSATVQLKLLDDDSTESTVNIPSFLYLENKIQRLQETFDSIVHSPESGEAWLVSGEKPYRLSLVGAATSPKSLKCDTGNLSASASDNTFFKDLVFPRLNLNMTVSGLSPDIEEVKFTKTVFKSRSLWEYASSRSDADSLNSFLSGYKRGSDYEQYISSVKAPLRNRDTNFKFGIIGLVDSNIYSGTLTDSEIESYGLPKRGMPYLYWDVKLDGTEYRDSADQTRVRKLRPGVKLAADRGYCKVTLAEVPGSVAPDEFRFIVTAGSLAIMKEEPGKWSETYDTWFSEDTESWSDEGIIGIPLEEDRYISVSVAPVRGTVRGRWSKPLYLDLEEVNMRDETGRTVCGTDGRPMSYMKYYRDFASNAGDALVSVARSMYPGVANLTEESIDDLQTNPLYVPAIDPEAVTVTAINNHLTDATAVEDLKRLHSQKQEFDSRLSSIRGEIDSVLDKMASSDDTANLSQTLTGLYAQRLEAEKQMISLVSEINRKANSSVMPVETIKYRVRGHIDCDIAVGQIKATYPDYDLIGLDIQYKYKSISKDTVTASAIASSTFTSWNRYQTPYKDRSLEWLAGRPAFKNSVPAPETDCIKWNQVDIPITQGEDVIIRVRGIYSIGQPFATVYTAWSDEMVFRFPDNYTLNADVKDILDINKNDSVDASFSRRLIEDGYEEHVTDKIIDNNVAFLHQPDKIASGFYTPEQHVISLKDKLYDMNELLTSVNEEISNIKRQSFTVTAECGGRTTRLGNGIISEIIAPTYLEHHEQAAAKYFVSEPVTVKITNTGTVPLKLYSIFPGDHTKYLSQCQTEQYGFETGNYDIYPLYAGSGWTPQKMGQWIYFRNTNPFTREYDNFSLTEYDKKMSLRTELVNSEKRAEALLATQKQMPLRYIPHEYSDYVTSAWGKIELNDKPFEATQPGKFTYDEKADFTKPAVLFPRNFAGRYDGYDIRKVFNMNEEENRCFGLGIAADAPVNKAIKGYGNGAGAFLFTDLPSESNIQADKGNSETYFEVETGSSVEIPLIFQYYLDADTQTVTKLVYFDLRPSLFRTTEHYILKVTARYSDIADSSNTIKYNDNL